MVFGRRAAASAAHWPVAGVGALVLSLVISLGAVGCTQSDPVSADVEPTTVRVMQFNIEYGGTLVDFDSVPAAIEAADADVVAIQEGYGHLPRIAAALGWPYFDARTQTVSTFPLVTPEDPSSPEVLVAVAPGQTFGLVNVHLPSTGYGPNKAAAGATSEEIVAGERGRLKAVQPALDAAARLEAAGVPVVLTGDFNSPSHLDWTAATSGLRDHVREVQWPVTVEVEKAGLTDVYRDVHPDPVADPGLTWPASRPKVGSYNPGPAGKPADRIDLMFTSASIGVGDAQIVGEASAPDTDIAIAPWPGDHRGMVAELAIPLADPGPYVAPEQRLVDQGESVGILLHPAAEVDTVRIVGDRGQEVSLRVADSAAATGQIPLDTAELRPDAYEISTETADGDLLASNRVWVSEPGAGASLAVSRGSYRVGEPIEVSWADAPGNKWDWIGVYRRGGDPDSDWYKNWAYTGATIEGSAVIDGSSDGGPWPLPPGSYDILLLADDSYAELARVEFVVAH